MKVEVIDEYGHAAALLGLGLSYGITSGYKVEDIIYNSEISKRMSDIAVQQVLKGGSHAKFLESIAVWMDITAPRYWWQEFDTYRVGVTKQSESTMHTIKSRKLTHEDFEDITQATLESINWHIENSLAILVKNALPEGFLQRRVVCLNYKVLAHIYLQRRDHELKEWRTFIEELKNLLIPPYVFRYGHGKQGEKNGSNPIEN